MAKKKRAKQPPYSARTEKRPVQIWLTDEERQIIEQAAVIERRPMTQILLLGGLDYAQRMIERATK